MVGDLQTGMSQWTRSATRHYPQLLPSIAEDCEADAHEHRWKLQQTQIWRLKAALAIASLSFFCLLGINVVHSALPQQRVPSWPPAMPLHMVTFQSDPRFSGSSNETTDAAWGSLSPPGDGFITVAEANRIHLPPGISYGEDGKLQKYDIAVFHQLHCLGHVRGYLWTLTAAVEAGNAEWVLQDLLQPQQGHIQHCFDYLRQALMCAGDMTLEWPREEESGRRSAVDGWGVEHQCVSWEAVMHFMKENADAYD